MLSPDDSPRVAGHDVDAEAIEWPGCSLALLADELGAEAIVEFVDGMPVDGWRVLRRYSSDSAFLGAPVRTTEGFEWHTAYFQHAYTDKTPEAETSEARAVVVVRPGLAPLEASRAERRRGLELQWPVDAARSGLVFSVEIMNSGDSPVQLSEKELSVVGVVTSPGTTGFSFGYVSYAARQAPSALGPGQFVRVPVRIGEETWASIEPGSYELRAVLVDLGLQAPPLPIELSAAAIAEHANRPG
jgi:hypothetical protein